MNAIDEILSPMFSELLEAPPSPKVPFKVGQTVRPKKLGWAGSADILEIRSEHCRLGTMRMFDQDQSVWFHYSELLAT